MYLQKVLKKKTFFKKIKFQKGQKKKKQQQLRVRKRYTFTLYTIYITFMFLYWLARKEKKDIDYNQ